MKSTPLRLVLASVFATLSVGMAGSTLLGAAWTFPWQEGYVEEGSSFSENNQYIHFQDPVAEPEMQNPEPPLELQNPIADPEVQEPDELPISARICRMRQVACACRCFSGATPVYSYGQDDADMACFSQKDFWGFDLPPSECDLMNNVTCEGFYIADNEDLELAEEEKMIVPLSGKLQGCKVFVR